MPKWVNIPDSNFGKWLTTIYPTCMQGDPQVGFQMDTSCGGIVNGIRTLTVPLKILQPWKVCNILSRSQV